MKEPNPNFPIHPPPRGHVQEAVTLVCSSYAKIRQRCRTLAFLLCGDLSHLVAFSNFATNGSVVLLTSSEIERQHNRHRNNINLHDLLPLPHYPFNPFKGRVERSFGVCYYFILGKRETTFPPGPGPEGLLGQVDEF